MTVEAYRNLFLYNLQDVVTKGSSTLKDSSLELVTSFLVIASILAFITDLDFGGILKRCFVGLIVVYSFSSIHKEMVDLGFRLGSTLVHENNAIARNITSIFTLEHDGLPDQTWWDIVPYTVRSIKDHIYSFFPWLIGVVSLWFVKVTFTLMYWYPLILFPVIALFSILPITKNMVDGLIFTTIWTTMTPIVMGAFMLIIDGILTNHKVMQDAFFVTNIILPLMFTIFLITGFFVAKSTLGPAGLSGGITKGVEMAGYNTMRAIEVFTLGKAKALGGFLVGSKTLNSGEIKEGPVRSLVNFPKNALRNASHSINKNRPQTAHQIISGQKQTNLTRREKTIQAANAAFNPIQTYRDNIRKMDEAKRLISQGTPEKHVNIHTEK